MVVGLDDRFGSLFEIVELAQLVRNAWQDLLHSQANGALGVRHDAADRHRQGLFDLAQQLGQILLASAVKTASKQNLAREGVAQHPEHILGFEGLETVDGEDHVALLREDVFEPGLISEVEGEYLFVALEQIGDGAWRNGDAAFTQCLMDFRDAAMLAIAEEANQRDDVKAKLTVGQSPGTFLFGANGQPVARAA